MTTQEIDARRVARLAAYSAIVANARQALRAIVDLDESDCARYVAKADLLALDALIQLEHALEDMDNPSFGGARP